MAEHVYHFNHAGDPDRTDVLHGRVAGTAGLHALVLASVQSLQPTCTLQNFIH